MTDPEVPWFSIGRGIGDFVRGLQSGGQAPVAAGAGGEATSHSAESAFPEAGVDVFLSHFVIALRFESGDQAGDLVTLNLPSAVQTVARTAPFVHEPSTRARRELRLPASCTLAASIAEEEFLVRPKGFFRTGAESVWLQILNLDARADTPLGPVRIIIGETFKREYEDIFEPSLGAAQALGRRGFPAQLFFSPNAVIETPVGTFKTRPKALVGARITQFPPVGSYPSLVEPVALDTVEALRARSDRSAELQAAATIVGLAHPIDALVLDSGDPAFQAVERNASR